MVIKEQISDKDIERSLWFLNNKKKILKIIVIILILFCVVVYTISIFGFIKFFTEKDVSFNDFGTINFSTNKKTPSNLIVQDKQIVIREDGKYDFAITIYNPNELFAAQEIKYQFIINNNPAEEEKTFIMPGETKKIVKLAIESNTKIDTVDILFTDIRWIRIKQAQADELKKAIFETRDQSININPEDTSIRNWVEFKAKNISPYNFRNVKFYVFLYVGPQIVAINEIEQTNFKFGEERKLQTSWYYMLASYATAEIQIETNLLDENNYFLEK